MPYDGLAEIARSIERHPLGAWVCHKPCAELLEMDDCDGRLIFIFDSGLELDLIVPSGDGPIKAEDLAHAKVQEPFPDGEGTTYFIGGDVGAIKIGRTVNVAVRFKDIQACSPIPLRVLA